MPVRIGPWSSAASSIGRMGVFIQWTPATVMFDHEARGIACRP